jgi:hypothetical protein
MTTGLAQRADRDLHPRPVDQAVVDGALHIEVRTTRVAHRRYAAVERGPEVPRCLEELVRERAVQPAHQVDP